MQNIIATLPERMAEASVKGNKFDSATQAITIKSAARECFASFTEDEGKSATRVQMVLGWHEAGFTPGQVDQVLSEALLMAKEADIASGFTSEGKKGRAAYGVNQSVMATRASECRAVYGAASQGALPFLKEKGWQAAVNTARMWLAEKGKLWDGNNKPTKDERAARKEAKATHKVFMEAAAEMPMRAGENQMQYAARVAQGVAVRSRERQIAQVLEIITKWDADIAEEAIYEYLLTKGPDRLRDMGKDLYAAADELEKAQDIANAARSEEPAPF